MHPTRLGPYTIKNPLGRGGMGAVFEAVDEATGREVAVKTLAAHLGDDPGVRRRFLGEIETLKSLRHPCIVELLAFGEEDGQPYFAMELVRGRSLDQLLREGRRFSWRETVDVALAITRALKSAHDHGVIHRDLKPANLLFPSEPAGDAPVKLADFGIARLFGSSGQTMVGMVVGTAEYMAPEQATGGHLDHRVDLYALGLVIFAMLTGRPPFKGSDPVVVIQRQRTEPPPRLSTHVTGVPPELDDLVDRLLAKDPHKRPASALAVGRILAMIATSSPPHSAGDDDAASATSGDTSSRAVHLLAGESGPGATAEAATMPMPTRTEGAASLPQRPTEPDIAVRADPGARTTHFTTVEELTRVTRIDAERRGRRETLLRTLAAAGILAAVAAAVVYLVRSPTADELHARIRAIADDDDADLRDARGAIDGFLTNHPGDPRTDEIRLLRRRLDLDSLEKRARRRRDDRTMTPLEREYRAAMARIEESPMACAAALEAILTLHADEAATLPHADRPPDLQPDAPPEAQPALWLDLIRRQLGRLEARAATEREQDVARAAATLAEASRLEDEAAAAIEAESREAILRRRRDLLTGLVEIYGSRPHVAAEVDEARRSLDSPNPTPVPSSTP